MSINDAIDRACGITPEQRAEWDAKQRRLEAEGVLLVCPCGAKKLDERIPEYGTLCRVEVLCPKCRSDTDS